MGELDENARREIEDALQTEALSDAQKRQVASMIPQGVEGIVSDLQDLKKQHEILAADVGNLAADVGNLLSNTNMGSAFGYVKLHCCLRWCQFDVSTCRHIRALETGIMQARSAGAGVTPPFQMCERCADSTGMRHIWNAVCHICRVCAEIEIWDWA